MSLGAGDFGENSIELSITDIGDGAIEGITGATVHGAYRINVSCRFNAARFVVGLSVNDRIQEGENIIIHFSGHGSSYRCSDYYKTRGYRNCGPEHRVGR